MSKMKTVREWLNELPDGYRERALANYDDAYPAPQPNIYEGLGMAFDWKSSPEGEEFWEKVYNHYQKGSPLPPLPTEDDIPEPVEANPLCNISSEKTLLDEFAMVALSALIARDPTPCNRSKMVELATWSYQYADVMMEARKGLVEG